MATLVDLCVIAAYEEEGCPEGIIVIEDQDTGNVYTIDESIVSPGNWGAAKKNVADTIAEHGL